MSTGAKDKQCGQVRGPVQLAFAYSVDPIASLEQALTRVAVTTEEKAKEQIKKHGQIQPEMGRKEIVPYALYVAHGYISPFLAADTGFSDQDLQLLWEALKNMFEHDHSAARGEMASRKLYVFEHATPLGNAPAHTLFERLHVERADSDRPARAFTDYRIRLDWDNPPDGVTRHELL